MTQDAPGPITILTQLIIGIAQLGNNDQARLKREARENERRVKAQMKAAREEVERPRR